MRFGCRAGIEQIPGLAEAGFEFVELPLSALESQSTNGGLRGLEDECARAELRPEVVTGFPSGARVVGPDIDVADLKASVRRAMRLAAAAGATTLVLDSAVARTVPERFPAARAWDQLRGFLGAAAKLARRHRLQIAVEPLSPQQADLIHTVEEAWLLCHEVGHDGVGLAADLSQLHREREPYDALIVADAALLHVRAHVSGLASNAADGPDYDAAFAALRAVPYTGRVALCPELADPAAEGPKALRTLRRTAGMPP